MHLSFPAARVQNSIHLLPRVVAAGVLLCLLGCPPSREELEPGETRNSALFISVYFPSYQATAATLLIPREDGMDCEFPGYTLADDDEDFLTVNFARGDLHQWTGEYVPNGVSDDCSNNSYYYYYANLEDQRCLLGLDGVDALNQPVTLNQDARLNISGHDSSRVTGSIRSSTGQLEYFNATNCGERMQYGYPTDGTVPAPGREAPPSPWALRFR